MTQTITRLRGDAPDLRWDTELDDARKFCLKVYAEMPQPIYGPEYDDWDKTFRAATARCAQLFANDNGLRRGEPFNLCRLVGQRTGESRPKWFADLGSLCTEYGVRGDGFAAAPRMLMVHTGRTPDSGALARIPESLIVDVVDGASWAEPKCHILVLRRGLPTVAEESEGEP